MFHKLRIENKCQWMVKFYEFIIMFISNDSYQKRKEVYISWLNVCYLTVIQVFGYFITNLLTLPTVTENKALNQTYLTLSHDTEKYSLGGHPLNS